jgi:hypothetical protein
MERSKACGVEKLRQQDYPDLARRPTDHEEADHAGGEARNENRGKRKAPEKLRQIHEHQDLCEHPERPQHADRRRAVAERLEVQAQERVQGAVCDRIAEARGEKRQDFRRETQRHALNGDMDSCRRQSEGDGKSDENGRDDRRGQG